MVRHAREKARATGARAGLPALLLVSAKLAARQGRWQDAAIDLQEGLAIAREIGLPYVEALLLEEEGRMYAARGEPEGARARLEDALAVFRRLGAAPDVERIRQALSCHLR
jgi:tetratricopeptide (TPR) repeat protein